MSFLDRARLVGPFSVVKDIPETCAQCGNREFFQQSDFKRSLGLGMIVACSLLTFVLMAMGYNWFIVWSPMLVALVIDRTFAALNPLVVVCYKCSHIYRGLDRDAVYRKYGPFDLEIYDRYQYPERTKEHPGP
jgi:hypothetical protein